MPVLTDRDFVAHAEKIARDLVEHGTPLKASVQKVAAAEELNPEQLARLCEATNNAAFAASFAQKGKEGSADRHVEFDVVHARDILKDEIDKHAMNGGNTKAASWDPVFESRPLVERGAVLEKVAFVPDEDTAVVDAARAARDAVRAQRRSYKQASETRIELEMHKQAMEGHLRALLDGFRKGASFEAFEKEALDVYGTESHGALNALRELQKKPQLNYHPVKTASYPDTSSPSHRLFQSLLATVKLAQQAQTTLAKLSE